MKGRKINSHNNTSDQECELSDDLLTAADGDIYVVNAEAADYIVSNNAAKMLKVSGKGSTLSTVAGYNMKNTALKIQGGRFLQNVTVSGQNTGVGDLEVYGIIAADLDCTAQGLNCAATDIAGNFTVSGKA